MDSIVTRASKDEKRPKRLGTEEDGLGPDVQATGSDIPGPLDLALQARSRGEHEKALAFFENVASGAPNKIQPRLQIVRTLRALGRIDEARLHCQSILEKDPECSPALVMLGFLAFELEDYRGALEHFRAAATLKPLSENAQAKLARSLVKLGRIDEADRFCGRVLHRNPDRTGTNLILAEIAEQRGDVSEAIKHLDNVIVRKPEKTELGLKIIQLLKRSGRNGEAEARGRELVEKQPELAELPSLRDLLAGDEGTAVVSTGSDGERKSSPESLKHLENTARSSLLSARLAEEKGDISGAVAHLDKVAALKPEKTVFHLRIIALLRRSGRNAEAQARFRELVEKHPELAELPNLRDLLSGRERTGPVTAKVEKDRSDISGTDRPLENAERTNLLSAKVAEERGDIAAAIKHLEKVAAVRPDKAVFSLKIIALLRRTGRNPEAEARCRDLLQRNPDLPEAAHVLGLILWKRGESDAALEQLGSAAERKPSDLNFQLTFARMLRSANRLDEARSRFRQILERFPDKAEAVLGLANIARMKMELPEALALFREAARLDPADPVIPLEISFILLALHRADEAEEMMQLAETLAAVRGNAFYAQRRFENFCQTEQWEKAEQCLAGWPHLREVPPEMIPSLTRYFVERRKWDELVEFFRTRIVEAGWSAKSEAAEHVIDFVAIAARQTGRYAEILGLLDGWSSKGTNGLGAKLREQLCEEVALLQAVDAIDPSLAESAGTISDPLRRERNALRLRVLYPERQHGRSVADARIIVPPGQQLRDTLFYCTDADYLLAGVTSLFSLLRHNNSLLPPCRFVVWCSPDVLAFASEIFGTVAEHFGQHIEVLNSATLFSSGLRFRMKFGAFTGRLLSEAAYYRIFAATQLSWESSCGRALYIDSDTCCAEGIDRLLSFDLQGHPLAARRESPDWPGTLHCSKKLGLQPGAYFNSGILLFDLAHPMLQAALEHSVDVALQQQQLLTNLDQCALNLGFKDQVTSLDAGFNYAVRNDREDPLPIETPTIVHFTAFPKPWDPRYRNPHCMLWFSEFEALSDVLAPQDLKRLAASFIPQARTVHGICVPPPG